MPRVMAITLVRLTLTVMAIPTPTETVLRGRMGIRTEEMASRMVEGATVHREIANEV